MTGARESISGPLLDTELLELFSENPEHGPGGLAWPMGLGRRTLQVRHTT